MTTLSLQSVRCFLFDMDGTVYLGGHLLPGAVALVEHLQKTNTPFFFLTNNSSKSKRDYFHKLTGMGLPIREEQILTSGEATASYIRAKQPGARIFLAGTPALEQEFREHGFHLVQNDPQWVVLGFDMTLNYEKVCRLCDFVRSGTPYVATHPDINCPTENGPIPDIGSMMALVETSTGRKPDVIVGKPYQPIVEAAVQKTGFQPFEIAMVGDRLYTDIALGKAGVYTVLVLSGETQPADIPTSPFQPDLVVENLAGLLRHLHNK